MSLKGSCSELIAKLETCANHCEKLVNGSYPKAHCIQPAKDAAAMAKNFVASCKQHSQNCAKPDCKQACHACIPALEKAIEKANACASACGGAGSDQDAKEVARVCAQVCKAAVQVCKTAVGKFCA
ncbi:hypothetical protein KAZ82_02170 [Candidatus Babeliales bacterium]|nr:hypothetical protein [Candidatus Babeliales bacterium]